MTGARRRARRGHRGAAAGALLALGAAAASAAAAGDATPEESAGGSLTVPLDTIVITATKIPEPADRVPAAIAVISGDELRARGATDMAAALSLSAGVEAPAGGDAGPSSAVLSFWGLHEFDAFLLVVDDVPWGGAYNPAITTLDFTDALRVEVLKGAAPVIYGATSFVGIVNVMHYPAGQAAEEAELAYGSYGSLRGSASLTLPGSSAYRESLAFDGERAGFADAREETSRGWVLYRSALDLGAGTLRIDADTTVVRDTPPSPVLRVGTGLTALTPTDANFNPADARIDEDKYHLTVGYSLPTAFGAWESLASYAWSDVRDIRGFLHPDLSGSADTQNQRRYIGDAYLDTHIAAVPWSEFNLVVGADALIGHGEQTTLNGNSAYTVPLDGSVLPPPTWAVPVNEIGTLDDRRFFAGQYVQADWQPTARWDVIAGVRLNEAWEHKISSDQLELTPLAATADVSKTINRPTETLGASYRLWGRGRDETLLYADYRNAFKPAAIDFGPDYTPELLEPEQAQSYEAGLKGAALDGRLSFEAELFRLDFTNLVVATPSGALANAAGERLEGVEAESRFELAPDLVLALSAAYHDATFTHYLFFDGVSSVDVSGRQLTLAPHVLAAFGVLRTPQRGLTASAVVRYVGRRFLDEENSAPVGGYTTLDAGVGYSFGRCQLSAEGTNLTNQRPPVTASEFSSESFYLLPPRLLWLRVRYSWR